MKIPNGEIKLSAKQVIKIIIYHIYNGIFINLFSDKLQIVSKQPEI